MDFLSKINKGVEKLSQFNDELQKHAEKSRIHGFSKYLIDGESIEYEGFKVAVTNFRVLYIDSKVFSTKAAITGVSFNKINSISIEDEGSFKIGRNVILAVGGRNVEIDMIDTSKAFDLFMIISKKLLL